MSKINLKSSSQLLGSVLFSRAARIGAVLALGAVTSFYVFSLPPAPTTNPLINLSSEPLYSKSAIGKPTLTLALSVEFPTVGAQYTVVGNVDNTYAFATEYIGYFDANSCYNYTNDPNTALRRFSRYGVASAHKCGGAGFSGNFMNWATSSAIDVLRLGLTGGDRIVDDATMTVLQRAVLFSGEPALGIGDFYNSNNFPAKQLSAALVFDSVPTTLKGSYTGDIWISNCLNKMHFGTQNTGNCNSPGYNSRFGVAGGFSGTAVLSSDNFFYTRVQVCEVSGGSVTQPRPGYCLRYPNGNYKPVGNLQKYSDRVRVAAFGYLMDDDRNRYGGVLRASMKYVGPKSYDNNGVQQVGTNPRLEWDENTGVFAVNPDVSLEGKSGVANYLNQFGRTGATSGVYKTYDAVGELYYEALRYVQGLPPTPQAVSGITSAMKAGFQVYDTWVDPHAGGLPTRDYSCLNNNIVLIGDVNTHVDKSIPGYSGSSGDFPRSASIANNEPNFVEWTRVVGEFEAGRATSYLDNNGVTRLTSNPNSSSITDSFMRRDRGDLSLDRVSDDASYFIAGMSYWARTHDIRGANWTSQPTAQRPGMKAKTFILDVNEYGAGNTLDNRRNNQFFLASKYGSFRDSSGIGNPYLNSLGALDNSNWSKALTGVDAGEAQGYFLSSSAQSVLNALDTIFSDASAAANSVAGAAASAANITSTSTDIFVAKFLPDTWSGDLQRYQLTQPTAGAAVTLVAPISATQSAAQQLDAPATVAANRNIYVGRTIRPISTDYATAFKWASIEAPLQALLNMQTPVSAPDGLAQRRLDFLRGERVDEGGVFRSRGSRLGDIINSGAAYSGVPNQNYSSPNYKAFYSANVGRTKAVFVGANDGMLHAFDVSNMKELFAYIPSWVTSKLPQLTALTYNSNHTSYVDGTPEVHEAEVNGNWKTVLVAGTGAGGQGVVSLDVTDPTAFDASKVMWEFTDRDDVDMGNVIGRPQILKFRTSAPGAAGPPTYKWFAAVPGGVNNYQDDGYYSTTGKPALFLLDLSKPATSAWVLNSNYYKISFPITSDTTTGTNLMGTGIVNFNPAFGGADEVTKIYASDLHGNVWRLSFDIQGAAGWNMDALSEFRNGSGNAVPFYSARDALGKAQPITMAPMLNYGPDRSFIVSFGTGKYLESSDNVVNALTQNQSVYALYDNNKNTALDTSGGISYINGRGRLQQGSVTGTVVSVPPFEFGRPSSDSAPERAGWYFDFANSGLNAGERQITDFDSFGNSIVFNSIIPPNASVSACGGGSGTQYQVNLATGTGSANVSTVGILGKPIIFESSADRNYSSPNAMGGMSRTTQGVPVSIGQNGLQLGTGGANQKIAATAPAGRLTWRQISNYQELKAAP